MSFKFRAGVLCLDFANTVAWHAGDLPEERLLQYDDLVEWAHQADLLTGKQRRVLREASGHLVGYRQAVLARARRLREALYRVFSAIAAKDPVAAADLAILNEEVALSLGRMRVSDRKGRFEWAWHDDARALDCMLWPVSRSAAELLIAGDHSRIRQCEGLGGCGWLFLDTTRNRSRRWCDMRDCGNRVKVRRYYRKRHAREARSAAKVRI